MAERKNRTYQSLIEELTPDDILPGIRGFLGELRSAGVRIGLASASRSAAGIVRRLEMENDFDAMVDPAAVCCGKPDPEIFFQAAELLGMPYHRSLPARPGIRTPLSRRAPPSLRTSPVSGRPRSRSCKKKGGNRHTPFFLPSFPEPATRRVTSDRGAVDLHGASPR